MASNASTEVDADAEDNDGDEDSGPASTSSSSRPRRATESGMGRDKHERLAKREALKAIRHGDEQSVSSDRDSNEEGTAADGPDEGTSHDLTLRTLANAVFSPGAEPYQVE